MFGEVNQWAGIVSLYQSTDNIVKQLDSPARLFLRFVPLPFYCLASQIPYYFCIYSIY